VLPRLPLSVLLRGNVHLVDADRIVGGEIVEPNSLPFQISLQRRSGTGYSQSCGGSIYKASVIINAAHCVSG
jgi:trypsin